MQNNFEIKNINFNVSCIIYSIVRTGSYMYFPNRTEKAYV